MTPIACCNRQPQTGGAAHTLSSGPIPQHQCARMVRSSPSVSNP
ncbi:MAG: hypothetical protein ACK583_07495 [Cyanobacteriota bacterium]